MTKLFTIGFTQKSAEEFFTLLIDARVNKVIDIRLNNMSQLAGFAKREDLRYFLKSIAGIDYVHLPQFAPTQEMLDRLKKKEGDWSDFRDTFQRLIRDRQIEKTVSPLELDGGCLLCSEVKPDECHRKLVADYLNEVWGDIDIVHL
ncbi:MAG TPA: hypothetical protein DEB39_08915 [Planctomycetaceae bacterium]|nr:hypothetical protein [Planctomycetaceae bacterium]